MELRPLTTLAMRLRDLPIRQKLVLIVMATTSVALGLAGIGIILADLFLFRAYLRNDLSALSQIVADNSTAPLSFEDPATATEILATLHARSHVMTACILRNDGALFARYLRVGAHGACPAPESGEDIRFDGMIVSVSRPIVLQNRRLGTLVMAYDPGEIFQRVKLYGAAVVSVFLLSTLAAFLLSSRLRRLIATPVSELARVATRVSRSRDYSIRAQKFSGDELGLLVDAFNEMLSGIQSRDSELKIALLTREAALEDAGRARQSLETTLDDIAQLNADLRTSNENLARSNEDLERFAFIASHDLQEPLRMITIYAQLLVRSYGNVGRPQVASFIENIEGGTRRMRELLADLLAYVELGARFDEPAQAVDLNLVVKKAQENLAFAIAESQAVITVSRLPVILGFESHFAPLFQNLIGNAIKYRSDQKPKIEIVGGRMNGFVQICVGDNGIGIAPEYHAKIFAAFKRLHGKAIPGTGIGLAICQRVVERYGGRIWVESEIGHGSNFIFTLPASLIATAGVKK